MMFVGQAGVGKHKFARALEEYLFAKGMAAYMLDGSNILLGVDADLLWVQSTQQELVRRFAEVTNILLNAGHIVVSTTNAIGLADFAEVQTLLPNFPVMIVNIDPSEKSSSFADIKLTGKESENSVLEKIIQLLKKRQIVEF